MESMWNESKAMKVGLIAAVLLIVVRILLELIGAPVSVASIFGVVWLYFIMPAVFAVAIKNAGHDRAFGRLMKDVVLFAAYTRIMVAITYIAAHYLNWTAARFSAAQGGTVGQEIQTLQQLLFIAGRNAAIWIVMAAILGAIVGSISLLVKGKRMKAIA
jgi:hypothetical protein